MKLNTHTSRELFYRSFHGSRQKIDQILFYQIIKTNSLGFEIQFNAVENIRG